MHKLLRMYLSLEFVLSNDYTEDATVYGEADSASNYEIELGAIYNFQQNMKIFGSFLINSSEITFRNPSATFSTKETGVNGGIQFNF